MNRKGKRKCPDTRLFLLSRDVTSLLAVAVSTGVENMEIVLFLHTNAL